MCVWLFGSAGSSVVERSIAARRVTGSNPVSRSFFFLSFFLSFFLYLSIYSSPPAAYLLTRILARCVLCVVALVFYGVQHTGVAHCNTLCMCMCVCGDMLICVFGWAGRWWRDGAYRQARGMRHEA